MLNRAQTYLGEAKSILEPLITSGNMRQLLPLIQRAQQDPEYAQFVVEAYNRRVAGKPLIEEALAQAQAAGQAQVVPQETFDPNAMQGYGVETDPFLASALAPLQAKLNEALTWQQQQQAQAQQVQQQQQQQAREQQELFHQLQGGHQDLAARYPDEFTGDLTRDQARFNQVVQYATQAGYDKLYGVRASLVLAADALRQARSEYSSPAAELLAQNDQALQNAAAIQAASARNVGGGAPPAPAARQAPKPVAVNRADGTRKSPKEYANEVIQSKGLLRA